MFLGASSSDSSSTPSFVQWGSFFNFLSVPPGCAIIDPGAAQDLIGKEAFEALRSELAKSGLQPVVPKEPPPASRIGGSAKPLFVALTPCFLGGFPRIIRLAVIDEDVPHLLSELWNKVEFYNQSPTVQHRGRMGVSNAMVPGSKHVLKRKHRAANR